MDIYKASVKRLQADPRSTLELARSIGVNSRTLHDIKAGQGKFENIRLGNARKIVAYYFPSAIR